MPLVPRALHLDPRPTPKPPIADAINIPIADLPQRMHELPPRNAPISIAGPEPYALEALAFLAKNGRKATIACDWSYGESERGRLWEPTPFLLEVIAQLQPGSAADLACGNGRDAVAMAAHGWKVPAIDHLQDALELGKDLAARYLTSEESSRIEWIKLDLEASPELQNKWDLVTMFRYLNRDLIRSAPNLLNPGGSLVIETFTTEHRERHGKPRTEDFVLQPGELKQLVHPLQVIHYEEGWHDGSHTARVWASLPRPVG
jgi:tellurite methyltransferase